MTKSTITREQLLEIIETDHVQCGEASYLARMELAAMDQKPALHRYRRKAVEPYGPYPWHYEVFVDYPQPFEDIEDEYFYAAPPVVTGFAVDGESECLPLDYLQGHKDGLEWAAKLAEANHPETGDWLYDDPIELAKAIRKGPYMPPVQPVADSEQVAEITEDLCRLFVKIHYPTTLRAGDKLYRHAQPPSERDQVRIAHAEWSQATFGNVGPVGPLKHLSKEALEAAAEPGDLSEWADIQFLLWDAQRRAGVTDEQITQAMIEKLAVNKQRKWPAPKDGEPRLHIKEQPAPIASVCTCPSGDGSLRWPCPVHPGNSPAQSDCCPVQNSVSPAQGGNSLVIPDEMTSEQAYEIGYYYGDPVVVFARGANWMRQHIIDSTLAAAQQEVKGE